MRKWLRQAHVVALASDQDVKHGCVFVEPVGGRVVAGGVNTVPSQVRDISSTELSATLSAISLAARTGVVLRGTHLYTTEPSLTAQEAKILVTCGIRAIFRHAKKRTSGVDELLEEAGIYTEYYENAIGNYPCSS